ncbi:MULTISPECIES: FliI/YscN family ATPase [unclassified Desulfovibrio]|uniref:FliI/YscN family ATPase n=1 Tax=unclassified Desulfovibrio TaxID=2593640 RepID=UPI0013E9D3C3|nr:MULTISPECIES: FliI/YscN family ATPase [unclassified Desulfovibrio]
MKLDPRACRRLLHEANPIRLFGKVNKVVGLVAEGSGLRAPLGAVCHMLPEGGAEGVAAEVVGFRDGNLLFMPYGDMRGIRPGSLIRNTSMPPVFPVGPDLLGRAFDAFGTPLDAGPPVSAELSGSPLPPGEQDKADYERQMELQAPHTPEWAVKARQLWQPELAQLYTDPPSPLQRPRITDMLDVGVRSINSLITLGKGQRVGIMAGSGVGKSTLMGMMARYTKADVNVIALIGERGREVVEFMERDLGPSGMARSVLVIATSDQSPLVRMRAAYAATAVAEYFRDKGMDVLLMMDSVTRFAMAAREVGLAVGEPPTTKGYTPSVFAQLPKLLERAGRSATGTITGIYTVLVDGDDFNEPIADAVRSILDGHIVLTRDLADQGHFPAIDVLRSISRLRSDICPREDVVAGRIVTRRMSTFRRVEDMVNIGAYAKGSNAEIDEAISAMPAINAFLCQEVGDPQNLEQSMAQLRELAGMGGAPQQGMPRPAPQGAPQVARR